MVAIASRVVAPPVPVHCPNCRSVIAPKDINVDANVAYCRACDVATPLSVIGGASASPHGIEINLNDPPAGAWYRDDGVETVIGATTRSLGAVFLVPFTLVWGGFSLGGIYGSQIVSGKFSVLMSIFGIPFAIGSVVLAGFALMAVAGRVEVILRSGEGVVFTGVGSLGWRRPFDAPSIRRVYEDAGGWSKNGRPTRAITLEGVRRLKFGTLLSVDRRIFVLNALQKTLGV